MTPSRPHLDRLRRELAAIETSAAARPILTTGNRLIDAALPWNGVPVAALHDIEGGIGDAAALGFTAGLAATAQRHTQADVLWCRPRRAGDDRGALYAPGLAAWGLDARRMVFIRGNASRDVLWAMEEGLRARAFAAVVGDGVAPDFTAARRLQLAADGGPALALTLHPAATAAAQTPALTRWRIAAQPAAPGEDGLMSRCWRIDLLHCRGGAPKSWVVRWAKFLTRENADAPLSGAVAAPLADGAVAARPDAPPNLRRTAGGC